jgi:hypothetical protein
LKGIDQLSYLPISDHRSPTTDHRSPITDH